MPARLHFFGGELRPLGTGVAFVELALADAVEAYAEWGARWQNQPRLVELGAKPILELMGALLPLEQPYKRRLLVGTTSGWTAILDNSRSGGDPFPPTHLARMRGVRAVAATHRSGSQNQFPATQFHLFGPTGEPPLAYVRTIDAGIFDEGRWRFLASGEPQPYEDLATYKRRRIRDRFTREMLLDYLAALGIRGDDPSFFTEGVLAVDTGSWLPGWTGTLEEARATST